MARLSPETWILIRAERESSGIPFRDLAAKYGVSDVAIVKRSKAEGWSDGSDGNALANRLAREKAAGITNAAVAVERQKSIEVAAKSKADVLLRQQRDCEVLRDAYPIDSGDKETVQLAKAAAEARKILHEMERKAHGITDEDLSAAGATSNKTGRAVVQWKIVKPEESD